MNYIDKLFMMPLLDNNGNNYWNMKMILKLILIRL